MNAIQRRQILPSVAVFLIAQLMQEHALSVDTWFMPEPGGAVLGRSQLCPKNSIPVLRPVDSLDTSGSIVLLLESDVYTEGLCLAIGRFAIAYGNLLDIAILAEEFRLPEGL